MNLVLTCRDALECRETLGESGLVAVMECRETLGESGLWSAEKLWVNLVFGVPRNFG